MRIFTSNHFASQIMFTTNAVVLKKPFFKVLVAMLLLVGNSYQFMKNFTHAFFTTKSKSIKWVFAMLAFLFLSTQASFGQTNYATWNFATTLGSGSYLTSANQNGARTSDITTNATFSSPFTLSNVTGATAFTFHRTTGWPTATSIDVTEYVEYSITLTNSRTFDDISLTQAVSVQTSSATAAPTRLAVQYSYGAAAFAAAGTAATIGTTTTNPTFTVPAPGNTTSTLLRIRLHGYNSTTATGNLRLLSLALTGASGPLAPVSTFTMTYNGNSNTSGSAPTDGSSPYAASSTVTVLGNTGTLARTNYTFSGWNTLADGSGTDRAAAATFAISANTTLYAKWTGTVTYDGNSNTSGTAPSAATVIAGATHTVLSNSGTLARTGYTFAGWNTAADGTGTSYTAGSGTFTFAGNTTLYARWTASVTYNSNSATSGLVPSDATAYRPGQAVSTAANSGSLARAGYSFAGWNTLADGTGTNYAVSTSNAFNISGNTTLYAKWDLNAATYSVTYDANSATSGSVPTDNTAYSSGASVTTAANSGSLALTGYTFAGWNTAADGTGTSYAVSTASAFAITGDITLYARWTATVTYNSNSATSGSVPTDATAYRPGQSVTTAANSGTLARTGYTFAGWNTTADGTGTSYTVSQASAFNISGNTTLYARWTAAVTYNANSATSGSVPTDATAYRPDQSVTTAANSGTLARTGYTFAGWNTVADGTGTTYAVSTASAFTISGNITLFARWTATVTYDANSATSGTVPTDATVYRPSQSVTTPANSGTLARTGYTFSGWNTAANGTGMTYAVSTASAFTISGNITLYARWTATVTYNANSATSGTVPTDATAYRPGQSVTTAANSGTLARTGYTFAGWNTTADGTGTTYAVSTAAAFSISGDITLYAKWQILPCATEDFENMPASNSSSLSRTWTGTNGLTWTAEGARTDRTLNGRAISFGSSGNRWVTSPSVSGGIGNLTFDYVRDFTGTGIRTIQVFVNGDQIGSDISVSATSDVVSSYNQNINIGGPVVLEIRSTGANQVKIDNISWQCYAAPEINVKQSSTSLASGSGSFSLGTVTIGNSSSATTFTIENTGTATLNLTGTPKVAISGHTSDFTIDQTSTTATVSASGTTTTTFTVTFSPTTTGARSATISIANDDSNENPYTFTVTGTGATLNVNLSVNATTGTEAGTTVITATATASAAVSGDQTLTITPSGTGITAGDYTLSNTTVTIANGATTGSVTFTVVDDAVYECTETATLTISSPSSGIVLGSTTTQNVTITDNDFPTVNLSTNTTTGSETGLTSITLTATASAAVIGAQTVSVGLSGTGLTNADFLGASFPATITIANGATTGTVTFTIVDDPTYEGTENATFTISSPSSCVILGATTTQGLAITDNDLPAVNLSIDNATGTEVATTSITLTATTSAAVVGDQTVNVALSGAGLTATDFTGIDFSTAQTITILNGATTGTRTFAVANDATYECAETATFTISAPTSGIVLGATTTATHAITDNDFPTVNLSINTASGSEAATTSITLTATASAAVIGAQTVSVALTGTGLANADFLGVTFPATITIANGATTGTRTFTIVDDSSIEGDESATFTISSPSSCVALGATTTQGLTIVENDFPTAPCSELFISEYVEGSSSNKYIEIYNPTSSSISLTAYSLRHYANGASSPTNDVVLSGTIPAYGTVVYQNSGETAYLGTGIDNAAVNFNGDDAVALAKSGVNIDIFGRIGDDPGAAWTSGAFTTVDKTLVRNAAVQVGIDVSPTGTGAGAFTTLSTEWTQSNNDVVSNLGSHTCDCFVANPVVTLGINTTSGSEASATSITLTATADAAVTGDQTVQVTLSGSGVANADFSSVTFPTNITILNAATSGTLTFTINNDLAVEGDETATFTIGTPSSGVTVGTPSAQNLVILDDDNLTSTESVITSVGGEAATISSLTNGTITTSTEGTQVWQFRLYDGNGSSSDADTKPTIYEQWVIRPSVGNTVPDWSSTLNNIKFFQDASGTPISGSFVVNSASISFIPTTAITVSDNGFALISLRVTIDNPLAANSDGLNFGFSLVPADVTVETDVLLSSQLGAFTPTSNGTLNVIDIDATLQFISAPSTVGLGDAFTITISAIDANGNIDQDDNTLITLAQNTGTGNLTGENAANLVNGTYTWTGLTYDTEETFQVLASGGSYTSITANINVVDEEFQLFDHFNRADGNSLGVPSSGGSTSWTETEAGDGTKVRIFSNMLMLDNCIASDPSGSSGSTTTERVTFNAETYFETIFDDAGSTLNWLFNMRSNNSNLSGFASSAYAMAFVLGSDQADFTAAGSDGYAVVVGNSGATDNIKLVKFTNGLNLDANVIDIVASNIDINADHASVKVSFDPCSGEWTLYARNDGASFVAPNVTTPAFSGPFTATNTDHSALDLKHFGALWKHNSSCVGNDAFFDNFYIPNSSSASTAAKVWNGSVNANWNTAANWGPCPGVPTNTDDVIIANVATQPIVNATPVATCKDLTVNAGADLTINSGQFLNVRGNVVNNGTANFGAGTLVMEGGATATLVGNVNVANFHVSSPVTLNGTVTVSSIARSEAGGAITANGNLVIESGAQLLHGAGTTNGGGSVSGNIVVRRQGTSSSTVYNYWSTPVVGGALPGSSGYLYNSSLGTHDFSDDVNPGDPGWQSFGGAMTNGRGYASRGGGLATFTGAANDATITYGVTTSANSMSSLSPGTRFNLSGNPYPSAISANSFISVNGPSGTGRIAGVLYFWDDDNSGGSGYASSDYGVWSGVGSVGGGGNTPNGFISTGQGFHVDAQSSGNISFTNAMRGGTNSQFFRLAEEVPMDRIWINLTGNDLFNQALVVFKDDATELRDVMYDAHKVRSNANIALGAMQANESFTIAAYPTITQARIVPLQTFVAQSGTYTFEADSIDGFEDIAVYLEDLQSGQMHLLSQGTTVTVQMTAQDEFNRFQLWFTPELVTNISQTEEQVSRILSTMNGFQVQMASDLNTIGEFKLYNAMGQIVMVQPLSVANGRSSMVDVSALPMGVYHAEFRSAEGTITAKTIK